jgi:hypothetical protein
MSHKDILPSWWPPITNPRKCSSLSEPNEVHSIEEKGLEMLIFVRSFRGSFAEVLSKMYKDKKNSEDDDSELVAETIYSPYWIIGQLEISTDFTWFCSSFGISDSIKFK